MSGYEVTETHGLRVRVGCDFIYESEFPSPMMVIVRPKEWPGHQMIDEVRTVEPEIPLHEYVDSFGNHVWRFVAPVGTLHLRYDALVEVPTTGDPHLPGLPKMPIEALPDDVVAYTLPSRYCQSDMFNDDAWRLFGGIQGGWEQVQAVCDWIHTNIRYGKGSTSTTSSWDVYQAGVGVCRDFAHMGVTFCRALNIPARYVCGYLPDIHVEPDPTPMDFHAWFEVFLDGAWRSFDARHNRHRTGRTLIASGRDAVDVALATIYGSTKLANMTVWADLVDRQFALEYRSNEA
ncbi:MAG: transglutaminase family protein [Herpetosiphonaceae bacterium]|nr:transglutaminase family protein [Herpetosiphonaceae bacterium]